MLLAFAAYPNVSQIQARQEATSTFCAWILRAAMAAGRKIRPPPHLSRNELPPAQMRSRVFKASRRLEFEALDLVGMGMDITFFRGGEPLALAQMLAGHFRAESASVQLPSGVDRDVGFLKKHLEGRKSRQALESDNTLRDFRRRVWKIYLPALPLLTAIHIDCLGFDPHKGAYGVEIPGHPQRYLAISLLCNPNLWIETVVQNATLRRALMAEQFPPNAFAEILGERPLPPWVQAAAATGCRFSPPDNIAGRS